MDRFIGDLRRHTHELKERSPAFGGATLCYSSNHFHDGDGDDDDDDAVLRCDRVLRTHFKNFAKALRSFDRRHERTSTEEGDELKREEEAWRLSRIELSEELRDILGPVLAARDNLRSLTLDRNEFGSDGVSFACNIVESNSCLREISFHNNPIEDLGDVARLCRAVSEHPSLERLSLKKVGLGDDEERLSMVLGASGRLECLGLVNNGVGSWSAAAAISRLLATNERLKTVHLSGNDFCDESAHLFASALKSSAHLRLVDLSGNGFTRSGRVTILNTLFNTSSLNEAVESNHNCVVYVDESKREDKLGAINCDGTPEENMHRKIFSTLYATTDGIRLGRLLEDVPLGLMPDLFEYLQDFYLDDIPRGMRKHAMGSLQQYELEDYDEVFSRQTKFTVVFEVLRNWNLPLLYTNI